MIETTRKSDRIMAMRLVIQDKTYNIVTSYAPQQGCEEEEKQRFWNQLAQAINNIPHTEELILAGDLNGHVGIDREEYVRWHGGKTRGKRNEEGKDNIGLYENNRPCIGEHLLRPWRRADLNIQERTKSNRD